MKKVLLGVVLVGSSLVACGPSKIQVDPANVVNVAVHPASGQRLFCPGDKFQVEVVAKLKDGSSCSNTNKDLGCMGKKNAVLDPKMVKINADQASPVGAKDEFVFYPSEDPLATAADGLTLHAWIEAQSGAKSMVGDADLKPVYSCMAQTYVQPPPPMQYGADGGPGPDLRVAVTSLSTPYYPDAALIRIEAPSMGMVRYVISPSQDAPVDIVSKGQSGAAGQPGAYGAAGAAGASSSDTCGDGQDGGPGQNGGDGGDGGAGGPGGRITVFVDGAMADRLIARLRLSSVGGDGGAAGYGGAGGPGGAGGSPGPMGQGCSGKWGQAGQPGQAGQNGNPGAPGPGGPDPQITTSTREALFSAELATITAIEAQKGKK